MKFNIQNDEPVYDGKYLTLWKRHFLDAAGKPQTWEMYRRKNVGRSVVIAAVTENNELILEKNFRVPAKEYILEFPAGLTDKKGEPLENAVRRELLEETGYAVSKITPLLESIPNPYLSDDGIVLYFGTGAKKIREPELESSEDLETVLVPLVKLPGYLSSAPKEIIVDMKVYAVSWLLKQKGWI